jgi:hypothetical protein
MCATCGARTHLLAKASPGEDSARRTFIETFVGLLERWHDDVLSALESGEILLGADEAARRSIIRTLRDHRDAITSTFETLWTDAGAAGRAATVRRYDLDVADDVSDRVARELRDYADGASTLTTERMATDIAAALRDAYDAGIGVPEMERILREEVFPDMRGYEAERVARTSATGAAARGAVSSIRDAGAPGKEWLAEDDARTRAAHRSADGQVVPVGAKFTVSGEQLWWPGDPRGSLANIINCRCGVAPAWELP